MDIAWFMGGTYEMFWSLYMSLTNYPNIPLLPIMGWVYLIIFIAFLIAFIIFYIQHKKEQPAPRNDTEPVQVVQE